MINKKKSKAAILRWEKIRREGRYEEVCSNISKAAIKAAARPETKAKVAASNAKSERKEQRRLHAIAVSKLPHWREAIAKANSDPKRAAKISKTKLKQWDDPEFRQMMIDADVEKWEEEEYRDAHLLGWMKTRKKNGKHPTSLERRAIDVIIDEFGYKYKFVGDGGLIINGRNPDFVHTFFKHKLIETYGSYYHVGSEEKDRKRIRELRQRGYKVLVLWDYDFNDKEKLHKKLRRFHSNRNV